MGDSPRIGHTQKKRKTRPRVEHGEEQAVHLADSPMSKPRAVGNGSHFVVIPKGPNPQDYPPKKTREKKGGGGGRRGREKTPREIPTSITTRGRFPKAAQRWLDKPRVIPQPWNRTSGIPIRMLVRGNPQKAPDWLHNHHAA